MKKSTPLTIACIAADLIPGKLGGAEHHAVEVVKRLAKSNKIYLFVGKDTSISSLLPKSVVVVPINYPKIPNLYGISFIISGYFKIKSYLKDRSLSVDVFWAKQSFPQAPLAALLKITFKTPMYITAQNPKLHYEELVVKGPLKIIHRLLADLLDPIISWGLKQADLVAAVSNYSAGLARQMGAKNVIVIPNGVNIPKPKNLKLKPKKYKTFQIFTASSLIPRNGIDILIDAVSMLPKGMNWELKIAGEGPEYLNLKSQITNLKLEKQIKLLGRVDNVNIPKYLSDSHIFVRPSRWEGFGVAFAEAMAQGIPVVGTPVGGIPDFVINRDTGLLAKPENPKSVARAILTLYSDKKLYKKIQTNAQRSIKTNYNWDIISANIYKCFQNLVNQTK